MNRGIIVSQQLLDTFRHLLAIGTPDQLAVMLRHLMAHIRPDQLTLDDRLAVIELLRQTLVSPAEDLAVAANGSTPQLIKQCVGTELLN